MIRLNETYLAGRITQEHANAGFGIILLLKLDKRVFDCVQLVPGVIKNACLQDFD